MDKELIAISAEIESQLVEWSGYESVDSGWVLLALFEKVLCD